MTSTSDLEKEVKRLIKLHRDLHGENNVRAYDVTEDIMRQYNYLNRTSVYELSTNLIKGDSMKEYPKIMKCKAFDHVVVCVLRTEGDTMQVVDLTLGGVAFGSVYKVDTDDYEDFKGDLAKAQENVIAAVIKSREKDSEESEESEDDEQEEPIEPVEKKETLLQKLGSRVITNYLVKKFNLEVPKKKEPRPDIKKRFGLINGRFQPFHKGHQEIVNEILLSGLIPIIVLGSSNHDRDRGKNPLTYAQRKELIRLVFPNIPVVFIYGMDFTNWDEWYRNLEIELEKEIFKNYDSLNGQLKDNIVIFHNDKEVDMTSFEFKGKHYTDTWYTQIFEDEGFETREVAFVKREDIKIDSNARDIRSNLEGLKHLLDARVYYKLKEWGW